MENKSEKCLMIRPNEYINHNEYKNCTLIKVNDEEYKFVYGTLNEYHAWVLVNKENDCWIYYPLGNKVFKSKQYKWLGDLLDSAVESMIGAKI